MDWLSWFKPWEFSPVLLVCFVVSAWLFVRGQRLHAVSRSRQVFFWLGWVMLYLSMHTMLDYYAERMFFIHRVQHLVLHHLGPLVETPNVHRPEPVNRRRDERRSDDSALHRLLEALGRGRTGDDQPICVSRH